MTRFNLRLTLAVAGMLLLAIILLWVIWPHARSTPGGGVSVVDGRRASGEVVVIHADPSPEATSAEEGCGLACRDVSEADDAVVGERITSPEQCRGRGASFQVACEKALVRFRRSIDDAGRTEG